MMLACEEVESLRTKIWGKYRRPSTDLAELLSTKDQPERAGKFLLLCSQLHNFRWVRERLLTEA